MFKKKKLKDLLPLLFLLIAVIVFFGDAFFLKGIFVTGDLTGSDILQLNYPIRLFAAESIRSGKVPLWLPDNVCGIPFLAEGQAGVFYPPQLLLYLIFPPEIAFNYSILVSFFLAGIFAYLYLRLLGIGQAGALLSGLVYSLSGFMVTHLKHVNMVSAAAWLPLLFLLVEKLFQKKGGSLLKYSLALAVIIAIQFFAGHPQISFISLLGVSFYFIYKLLLFKRKLRLVKVFAAALVLGMLISAVQILPTQELTGNSSRAAGINYAEASFWQYNPRDFIALIFPYHLDNPAAGKHAYWSNGIFWEKCYYVGWLALLLVFFSALFIGKNKYIPFFIGLSAFSFLYAMGKQAFLHTLLYHLPGFSYFRFPARMLLLFQFSAAVLAGIALEHLKLKRTLKIIIVFIVFLELLSFGQGHNPTVPMAAWRKIPKTVEKIREDQSTFRIYSYRANENWHSDGLKPYLDYREIIQPNQNIIYGLSDAWGYYNFGLRRNQVLFKIFSRDKFSSKVLGLLNVKYITAMDLIKDNNLEQVFETDVKWNCNQIKIYKNKQWLPRAFIVPKAAHNHSPIGILNKLFSDEFDPLKEVLIEEEVFWGSDQIKNVKLKIKNYESDKVEIDVTLSDPGFLVLSDNYYPGWKVYVDGLEGEIIRANYVMRAVTLNAGAHSVKFVYRPDSYRMGRDISLTALMLVVVLLVYRWKKKIL
ncbi:YfhO family protein [Candidatus Margulisiibacteriota bacterium]